MIYLLYIKDYVSPSNSFIPVKSTCSANFWCTYDSNIKRRTVLTDRLDEIFDFYSKTYLPTLEEAITDLSKACGDRPIDTIGVANLSVDYPEYLI